MKIGEVVVQTGYAGAIPMALDGTAWIVLAAAAGEVTVRSRAWTLPGAPFIRTGDAELFRRIEA